MGIPLAVARSAYIHVPFCRRRCGYCNFTLIAGRDDLIPDYLRALALELESLETPREVDTLFLGGGTPSHLAPNQLAQLTSLLTKWFPLSEGAEYSSEANPDDVDSPTLANLLDAGVTRISLGGQSFDASKLAMLERTHCGADLASSIRSCQAAGLYVALDLIFGAPGETLDVWRADLRTAVELNVDHISTYGLTFDRGAAFWSRLAKGELAELEEDLSAEMYETAIELLTDAGYEHYEVSNFAKPRMRCRHNEAYWLGRPYYAAGPGASRYVDGRRETNHRSTTTYIKRLFVGRSPVQEVDELSDAARRRERFVFGMRRCEGVDCDTFCAETGEDPREAFGVTLEQFESWGLVEWEGSRIRLTRRGLLVSDSMWSDVLLDEPT